MQAAAKTKFIEIYVAMGVVVHELLIPLPLGVVRGCEIGRSGSRRHQSMRKDGIRMRKASSTHGGFNSLHAAGMGIMPLTSSIGRERKVADLRSTGWMATNVS